MQSTSSDTQHNLCPTIDDIHFVVQLNQFSLCESVSFRFVVFISSLQCSCDERRNANNLFKWYSFILSFDNMRMNEDKRLKLHVQRNVFDSWHDDIVCSAQQMISFHLFILFVVVAFRIDSICSESFSLWYAKQTKSLEVQSVPLIEIRWKLRHANGRHKWADNTCVKLVNTNWLYKIKQCARVICLCATCRRQFAFTTRGVGGRSTELSMHATRNAILLQVSISNSLEAILSRSSFLSSTMCIGAPFTMNTYIKQ